MITYLLVEFPDNTYTLVDRRISRDIGYYKNLHDLIKAIQCMDYNHRPVNWNRGTTLFKTSDLKHIINLPYTHPEFFI